MLSMVVRVVRVSWEMLSNERRSSSFFRLVLFRENGVRVRVYTLQYTLEGPGNVPASLLLMVQVTLRGSRKAALLYDVGCWNEFTAIRLDTSSWSLSSLQPAWGNEFALPQRTAWEPQGKDWPRCAELRTLHEWGWGPRREDFHNSFSTQKAMA